MTRRDHEIIANIIRGWDGYIPPMEAIENDPRPAQRESIALEFARGLLNDNSRFKTSLFLKACGVAEAAK